MKTHPALAPAGNPPTWTARLCRSVAAPLLLWLLLAMPAVVQAQYNYTTSNNQITITGYTGAGGAVTIPDTINGLPVTTIRKQAFYQRTDLTSITIPNSVTTIGEGAFYACTGLTSVTIPDSVTTIGNSAFFGCSGLTSVTIPNSVTTIGAYAFQNCTGLTSVTISNSVTTILESAFEGCSGLTSVTIPNSVTTIGNYAFQLCTGLTTVNFQGNAPVPLGLDVFTGANNVTVYYLPGTTGWAPTYGGRPTAVWSLPNPVILNDRPGFGVKANGFGFIISWATNVPVVVEATTDLTQPVWTPVSTNTLTGGTAYFSDPQWQNYPSRLYRLRMP